MTRLGRSLTSGAAGALALTTLHELARRHVANAPRMDMLAVRALRRTLPGERHEAHHLHQLALAGDLLANSLYYATIPSQTPASTWMRAIALGVGAGLGALLLPERMGLGAPPHSERRANQLMTVAWYVAGAATTAIVATLPGMRPSQTPQRVE